MTDERKPLNRQQRDHAQGMQQCDTDRLPEFQDCEQSGAVRQFCSAWGVFERAGRRAGDAELSPARPAKIRAKFFKDFSGPRPWFLAYSHRGQQKCRVQPSH